MTIATGQGGMTETELADALFGPTPPARAPREVRVLAPNPPRTSSKHKRSPLRTLVDVSLTAAGALGISLLLNTFVVQTFMIPSESMAATLEVGDRVVVSRLVPETFDVHRGDIVVFEDEAGWMDQAGITAPPESESALTKALTAVGLNPNKGKEFLIKRVIGVGGDVVSADGTGPVTVNGVALDESYVRDGALGSEETFEVTVPPGCVWVMGDNRDHSADSRFNTDDINGGCVPLEYVYGVAMVRIFPFDRAGALRNPGEVFVDVPTPPSNPTSGTS